MQQLIKSTISDAKDLGRASWWVIGFGLLCVLFALVMAVLVFVLVPWPGAAVGFIFVITFVGLVGVVLNGIRDLAESERGVRESNARYQEALESYEAALKAYNDVREKRLRGDL